MRTFVGILADVIHYVLLRPLHTRETWQVRRAIWEGRWIDTARDGLV